MSRDVGKLVDPSHFQFSFLSASLDRRRLDHRTWCIFWKLWPTAFNFFWRAKKFGKGRGGSKLKLSQKVQLFLEWSNSVRKLVTLERIADWKLQTNWVVDKLWLFFQRAQSWPNPGGGSALQLKRVCGRLQLQARLKDEPEGQVLRLVKTIKNQNQLVCPFQQAVCLSKKKSEVVSR